MYKQTNIFNAVKKKERSIKKEAGHASSSYLDKLTEREKLFKGFFESNSISNFENKTIKHA